jgi:hypothetical protein
MVRYREIREAALLVDKTDGVDQQEGVVLAQYAIMTRGLGDRLYSLEPIAIEKKMTAEINGKIEELVLAPEGDVSYTVEKNWIIMFRDKAESRLWGAYPVIPFTAVVDMDTGEVKKIGFQADSEKSVHP